MQKDFDRLPITKEALCEALSSVGITENRIRALAFDSLPSTNTLAKEMADERIPTLIVANGQTGGRGRMGRSFACPDGAGVYMSLLIYPHLAIGEVSRLTCLAAVAAARAIERLSGISPSIKWVNDLYVRDKKLAGILTEGKATADGGLEYAVIGIGINLFPSDLGEYSDIATDVVSAGGRPTKRVELIAEILRELLPMTESNDYPALFAEYKARAAFIKEKRVLVTVGADRYFATVLDIEDDGRLKILTEEGKVLSLGSGEVSLSLKM